MKNNGSIYLHVFFTENGRSPNPKDKETYSKRMTFSTFKRIIFLNAFINKKVFFFNYRTKQILEKNL